jgi:hypothetical protein
MLRVWALLTIVLAFSPGTSKAQPAALDRQHSTSLLVEAAHPDLHLATEFFPITDVSWKTGIARFAARHQFGRGFAIVIDGTFAHHEWTEGRYDSIRVYSPLDTVPRYVHFAPGRNSASTIGNAYVGIEIVEEPLIIEVGYRPNFEPGETLVGAASDLSNWEPFFQSASLRAGFRTHTDLSRTTFGNFRGAFTFITGGGEVLELHGGATGTHRFGRWFVAPSLDARVLTASEVDERLLGQIEIAGGYHSAHFRPEPFARFYLNQSWRDIVSWTLGLRCGVF